MYFVRVLSCLKVICLCLVATACAQSDHVAVISSSTGEHKIKVEIADDDEERRVGLMYREELAPGTGMLFDFGETRPVSMWMKNTLIPLDMAFIDKSGVIRRIAENTTPRSLESIPSGTPVSAVLEVNAGVFERLGVKPGDKVKHRIFEPDAG